MSAPLLPAVRVVVADDETLARARVRRLLEADEDVLVVGEAADGAEALRAVETLHPELLFLDVQMPELDGIGVLQALGAERAPQVILTTAHDSYLEAAFRHHALDYLRKPFLDERFHDALRHARTRIAERRAHRGGAEERLRALLRELDAVRRTPERIALRDGEGRITLLETAEVLWVEAHQEQVRLHLRGGGAHLWRVTLAEAELRLGPTFPRVSRSVLVNAAEVRSAEHLWKGEYSLELRGGKRLSTGRSFREAVEEMLGLRARASTR